MPLHAHEVPHRVNHSITSGDPGEDKAFAGMASRGAPLQTPRLSRMGRGSAPLSGADYSDRGAQIHLAIKLGEKPPFVTAIIPVLKLSPERGVVLSLESYLLLDGVLPVEIALYDLTVLVA